MSQFKSDIAKAALWTAGIVGVFALLKRAFSHDDTLVSEEAEEILSVKGNKEEIDKAISNAKRLNQDHADVTLKNGKRIRISV